MKFVRQNINLRIIAVFKKRLRAISLFVQYAGEGGADGDDGVDEGSTSRAPLLVGVASPPKL